MTTTNDFARLLSAAKVLATSGDVGGAKTLLKAAKELLPASEVGICIKCVKRLPRETEALRQVEAGLRDNSAEGKAERTAAG